jgi:hypothetical protein
MSDPSIATLLHTSNLVTLVFREYVCSSSGQSSMPPLFSLVAQPLHTVAVLLRGPEGWRFNEEGAK